MGILSPWAVPGGFILYEGKGSRRNDIFGPRSEFAKNWGRPGAGVFSTKGRFAVAGSSLRAFRGRIVAVGLARNGLVLYEGKSYRHDVFLTHALNSQHAGAAPGAPFFCMEERFAVAGSLMWARGLVLYVGEHCRRNAFFNARSKFAGLIWEFWWLARLCSRL